MRLAASVLAGLLIFSSSSALAHEIEAEKPPQWRAVDAETGQIRDIAGLEQLAEDFPDSGTVRLRLLQPYLEAGEVEKVLATLEWLYDRGYVFGEVSQQQIPKLLEGVDPGRIAERLIAEAEVIEASEVATTISAEARLVESLVVFPQTSRIVASAVNSRNVFTLGREGQWFGSGPTDTANLSGMVLDPIDGHYWVASGRIDGAEPSPGDFHGLLKMSVPGHEKHRIAAPPGVNPSDIAIGPDGTLYASDPLGGGVYFAPSDASQLKALVEPGTFRSPQGLAVSEDNSKLYVSDYRYGIAIIDLATREISRLASDTPAILDGVDGIWRYCSELITVQNGTSPMRITAFKLSQDGKRVVAHRILEQAHPGWTEPLGGSISEGALYYVANGQWDKFLAGELGEGKELVPTRIRRLPLGE